MDRYWSEIAQRSDQFAEEGVEILPFIAGPRPVTRTAGRWQRGLQRYVEYPLRAVFGNRGDVVHLLDHSHSDILRWLPRSVRKIVTVHDLAPLRDSRELTISQLERFRKRVESLKYADLILTDSDFTASDVKAFLEDQCPEMRCLPLGVDFKRYQSSDVVTSSNPIERDAMRILCVGSNSRRKNLAILPETLRLATEGGQRVELIRVGPELPTDIRGPLLSNPFVTLVERSGLSESELIACYHEADILFFPSTLEGFGFPVLEAMAVGTCVLAARASSVPEIGLDTVHYFELSDSSSAARELIRLMAEPSLRASRIEAAKDRAKELDWSCHVSQLATIYHEVTVGR